MQGAEKTAILEDVCGKEIRSSESELTSFAIRFVDGTGLLMTAAGDATSPRVAVSIVPADSLPAGKDAVCSVDWSWIAGSTVAKVTASGSSVKLQLDPAGPLAVSALIYQGAPFLAFQPYKPAR